MSFSNYFAGPWIDDDEHFKCSHCENEARIEDETVINDCSGDNQDCHLCEACLANYLESEAEWAMENAQ